MSYPTIYTWPLESATSSAEPAPPNPGPPVASHPLFPDARKEQFTRGIKWGNVPANRADFATGHNNSVPSVVQVPIDNPNLSGVIRFRHRSPTAGRLPAAVSLPEYKSADRFGNPVFPFTGRYASDFPLIVIDSGFWNVQSPLTFPTRLYTADMLLDGRVVVAGGNGNGIILSGAQSFSSGTNLWSPLPDMPTRKTMAAGISLLSGDFFISGGSGSAGEGRVSYRYVSASNSWLTLTSTIVSRKDFEVVRLLDGRIFLPGGTGTSGSSPFTGSEIFEPDTNAWFSDVGSAPRIPLYPYNREGYTLTLMLDGSVLLVGGRDPLDNRPSDHVLRFFPNDKNLPGTTGSWTVEPSMSFVRTGHRSVLLDDGRVMIMGGAGATQANLQSLLPMYLGGQFENTTAISDVEIYDPSTRSVSHVGQMRKARMDFAAANLYLDHSEGRVLVCGGADSGMILSGAEICDVETFSWQEVAPLQFGVAQHRMVRLNEPSYLPPYRFIVPGGELSGTSVPYSSSQVYQTDG